VSGIYEEPELYELACAYREIPAEATALLAWCATHFEGGARTTGLGLAQRSAAPPAAGQSASGAAEGLQVCADAGVRSVLELAAGPAEHARELARRGLRAAALDRSAAMCSYAAAQAKAADVDLQVVEADMRDFTIKGPDGARVVFDAAITMLNSVCHLFTLDDLVRHLTAVRAQLVPGGLYIVELAHPADVFAPVPRTSSEWTIDAPGVHAEVRWGARSDRIDPLTQVTNEHMTITATASDGTIRTVSDMVPNRFWTLTEFTAAIELSNTRQIPTEPRTAAVGAASSAARPGDPPAGDLAPEPDDTAGRFELVATYGDFDETTALDAATAWRMILILRRA
jgi:SAM-dependent methyltransferase